MLTLDDVHLSLGDRQWEFDLALKSSSVYALLGRSGSGKSTLLNIIAGFQLPDSGDIRWDEQSLVSLDPAQRPVTTLFQQHNLFSHLTVSQNVGLGIDPGLKLDADQRAKVNTVLTQVGLDNHEHKTPTRLSGGEQQRVALARCLLRDKPILLLDEPFSALDATTRGEMIELLRKVIDNYKPCVVMVTHDEGDAKAMGASLLRLSEGTITLE